MSTAWSCLQLPYSTRGHWSVRKVEEIMAAKCFSWTMSFASYQLSARMFSQATKWRSFYGRWCSWAWYYNRLKLQWRSQYSTVAEKSSKVVNCILRALRHRCISHYRYDFIAYCRSILECCIPETLLDSWYQVAQGCSETLHLYCFWQNLPWSIAAQSH